MRPKKEVVKSIVNYLISRTTKEIQRFLSLASYFRRFILDFSVLIKLYDFLKKNVPFYFNPKIMSSNSIL